MYVHKWGYFLRCFFNVFIPKTTTYTVCPIALFLVVICVTWLWLVIMISQGKEKYCSVLCVCVFSTAHPVLWWYKKRSWLLKTFRFFRGVGMGLFYSRRRNQLWNWGQVGHQHPTANGLWLTLGYGWQGRACRLQFVLRLNFVFYIEFRV